MAVTTSPDVPRLVGASELLIDRALPTFDVTRIEHLVVDGDVATTWRALVGFDLMRVHSPIMDAAMFVRGVPEKVGAWFGRASPPAPPPELPLGGASVGLPGWLSLGRVEERELALGAIGKFWQPEIEWYDVAGLTVEDFATFDEPGWGRIAASFSLRPYGAPRTLLSYEARTATPDPASRRRFARYWKLVDPFVGHIMRATIATIAADASDA